MLRKIIWTTCMLIVTADVTAMVQNQYQSAYGTSSIVAPSKIYPYFKQGEKLLAVGGVGKLNIIVASANELKISATSNFFSANPSFKSKKLNIRGVNAPSNIASQPIGLDSGVLGAKHRIKNAKNMVRHENLNPTRTYYVAIENFFSVADPGVKPTDHAVVIIEAPNGEQFTYLSEGVEVDYHIYKQVVKPDNLVADYTGTKTSIGDFLAKNYGVKSADWFVLVTGQPYTREQQISTAFNHAK